MTENSNPTAGETQEQGAIEHACQAHRKLSALRQQLNKHPDLEEAISSLEMALSILTTKTGGML